MKVTLWGTRGSLASPGPDTARYGGNTSCVEVCGSDGTVLVLDAGTGIRTLGKRLAGSARRVDLLLTHLHMDHIQGLGFFAPLRTPGIDVHIWGPASTTQSLSMRLTRYLSPPLFPVHLRDLPCNLHFHEVPGEDAQLGEFAISSALICHPGPTVGYRIVGPTATLAYLPDHEPALGVQAFPLDDDWTSGYELARDADLLIHDAQYSSSEYEDHIGWGHSSMRDAFLFATLAHAKHLVPFHHDPARTDLDLDLLISETVASLNPTLQITPAAEGTTFDFRF